jgi:hypothetical protein
VPGLCGNAKARRQNAVFCIAMMRRGPLLVRPAPPGGTITLDEAEAALAASRDRPA